MDRLSTQGVNYGFSEIKDIFRDLIKIMKMGEMSMEDEIS